MRVKMILPALLEARDPGYRPIKYRLSLRWGFSPWPATWRRTMRSSSRTSTSRRWTWTTGRTSSSSRST